MKRKIEEKKIVSGELIGDPTSSERSIFVIRVAEFPRNSMRALARKLQS